MNNRDPIKSLCTVEHSRLKTYIGVAHLMAGQDHPAPPSGEKGVRGAMPMSWEWLVGLLGVILRRVIRSMPGQDGSAPHGEQRV